MQGSRFRAGRALAALALAVGLSASATAQFALTSVFDANNGQSGNMWDVVATNPITITSLDINTIPLVGGTYTVEVYTVIPTATPQPGFVSGSCNQLANTSTDATQWTLLATVSGVVGQIQNIPTPLGPNIMSLSLAAGERRGLYVRLVGSTSIRYTTANIGSVYPATGLPTPTWGNPVSSDANLTILAGFGKANASTVAGPAGGFGGNLGSATTGVARIWNGTIHYNAPFTEGAGQRAQVGLAVMNINDSAHEANGINLLTVNPNTGLLVKGPFQSDVAQNSNVTFSFDGAANQPIVLLAGPVNPNILNFGPVGQFDIGTSINGMTGLPNGIVLIASGTNANLPNSFFVTGASGHMEISFFVSGNFPLGVLTTYQAIMFTGGPTVVAFSNAVSLNIVP